MNQTPKKHHFIPVFYLKRWTLNGELVEFSKPYLNKVMPIRRSPDGTGYVHRLYEMRGVAEEQKQNFEELFMKPVDSRAADALATLENKGAWSPATRSGWSRFIMSLLLRTPEDMDVIKTAVTLEYMQTTPEEEAKYQSVRPVGAPETMREFIRQVIDQQSIDLPALRIAKKLIDHENIGSIINSMRWSVLEVPNSAPELLTSDRPVLMSAMLSEFDAYIMMPIGPRRLFVAVRNIDTERRVFSQPIRQLVKNANKLVVKHAVRYVFSTSDSSLAFVQKHMGTSIQVSLLERLARRRKIMNTAA
jgi:hypothetical protein